MITFTSASTVEHFFDLKVDLPAGIEYASIGPVTAAALQKRGLKPHVEAKQFTIPGLVAAIEKHYG